MPPTLAVAGIGGTGYRRSRPESPATLAAQAIGAALDDAGLDPGAVDGLVTEAAIGDLPADVIAAAAGIRPAVALSWSVGAAGTVGAALPARGLVATGDASVVVVVQVVGGAGRPDPYAYHAEDPVKATYELPMGFYGQAVYFATMAQVYRHRFGADALDEAAKAGVVGAARAHAARTPAAQRPELMDAAGYAASPWVAEPLRAADCCLVSVGATAYVLTGADRAADLRRPAVIVAGVGVSSGAETQSRWFTQRPDLLETGAARSAAAAFAEARLGPADVDLAEVYDCFSITPLLQLEETGLAEPGEAGRDAAAGRFGPGGALPVNTHGGLLAHGFCLGIGHVTEAVAQLRGDRAQGQVPDAGVALVAGLGVPHHSTLILTRGDR